MYIISARVIERYGIHEATLDNVEFDRSVLQAFPNSRNHAVEDIDFTFWICVSTLGISCHREVHKNIGDQLFYH